MFGWLITIKTSIQLSIVLFYSSTSESESELSETLTNQGAASQSNNFYGLLIIIPTRF